MSSDYNAFLKRNLEKVLSKFGRVALKNKVEKTDLASALQTEINSKASTSDLNSVASSVSTVSTGLSAVDTKVNTLIGNDQNKSARTIADEEVAKVIADAPASFDTLKEIADWISNHADDAAQMNSDIIALKAKTVLGTYIPEGEVDPVEYATVKAYVEAYVAEHAPTDAQRLVIANGTPLNVGDPQTPTYFNNGVPTETQINVTLVDPSKKPTTWTAGTAAGSSYLNGVTYVNGLFVAVDGSGKNYHSTDGINWTAGSGTSGGLKSVTYGGGLFVAVGSSGVNYHSIDGITWTAGTTVSGHLTGVIYGNGLFVAVGDNGINYHSTDGSTWTAGTTVSGYLKGVTYGNGLFVAVGAVGGAGGINYHSTDGSTWTAGTNAGNAYLTGVTYGNGLFVAVDIGSGKNYHSTDGSTWTGGSGTSGYLRSVTYGSGLFVAVGDSGVNYYSTDGITWTAGSGISGYSNSVTYGNGLFVAVGGSGKNHHSSIATTAQLSNLGQTLNDILSQNVIFTPASSAYTVNNFSAARSGNLCGMSIRITSALTANTWVTIGTLNIAPTSAAYAPLINVGDGTFLGYVWINGKEVNVYPKSAGTNIIYAFTCSFAVS